MAKNNIMADISLPLKVKLMKYDQEKQYPPSRRVGVSFFHVPKRRQGAPGNPGRPSPGDREDDNMKLKLFKLMYEAVRDTDVKVKRAELIQKSYDNSTVFELGFLIGDISEKQSSMEDLAGMLKRMYDHWKPVEHINAYEQIASRSIEIGHITELAIQTVTKLDSTLDHEYFETDAPIEKKDQPDTALPTPVADEAPPQEDSNPNISDPNNTMPLAQ